MSKTIKAVFGGMVLLAGGYLVYKYLANKKKGIPQPIGDTTPNNAVSISNNGTYVVPEISKYFPLKKGSSGQKVIELQTAIRKANPNLLAKYGIDGKFGSETQAAVQSLLGKKTVDSQDDIDKILAMSGQATGNARAALARTLIDAFNNSPFLSKDFYATTTTNVEHWTVNQSHYIMSSVDTLHSGEKLGINAQSSLTMNSAGFIIASYGNNYVSFSPYAFELK